VACDLFTVDTLWRQRRYVLFFIELHTRMSTWPGDRRPQRQMGCAAGSQPPAGV
jgi:hypothetical protein